MKKNMLILGVCLVLVLCFFIKPFEKKGDMKKVEEPKYESVRKSEVGELRMEKEDEEGVEREVDEIAIDEVEGLSDEAVVILGTDRMKIWKAIKKWSFENGYSGIVGVAFYPEMKIDFSEEKYSMECQLILRSEGNGTVGKNVIVVMDYYKNQDEFQFHKQEGV